MSPTGSKWWQRYLADPDGDWWLDGSSRWQDTGRGLFTLAVASVLLGLALPD